MTLTTDAAHCDDLMKALRSFRGYATPVLERWGACLAARLGAGCRLLAAGNGGSAAQAQHLTAELVGRYRDDRPPYSALALHADTSSTTAIANDYGVQEIFARQVGAHGRAGDVLLLLSTSGASANLLVAAKEAHRLGMSVWALTGPAPNPLEGIADEPLCVTGATSATVQELHLVAVHMLCESFDRALEGAYRSGAEAARGAGEGADRGGERVSRGGEPTGKAGDGSGQGRDRADRAGERARRIREGVGKAGEGSGRARERTDRAADRVVPAGKDGS